MKVFLENSEVFVVKGYLSKDAKKVDPIYNQKFIDAQKHAEYIIAFAAAAKGKDFKGKVADSLDTLRAGVQAKLSATDTVSYVSKPKSVARPTTSALAAEALSFINFEEKSSTAEKVNTFMQQFNVLTELNEVGLFFDQDITKMSKIYTIKEVTAAVVSTIDLLN